MLDISEEDQREQEEQYDRSNVKRKRAVEMRLEGNEDLYCMGTVGHSEDFGFYSK